MSDELRESAERLFEWARKHCADEKASKAARVLIGDTYNVAQAYLNEHHADDNEPVTEEWLEDVGIDGPGPPVRVGSTMVRITMRDRPIRLNLGDGYYVNSVNLRANATRGDVRTICKALGIALKESVPA